MNCSKLDVNDIMINGKLFEFKEKFFESKKFIILYLILSLVLFLSTISMKNIAHPKFELISLFVVLVLGIFCIAYYFMHNSDKEFYKVAFVVILCFGIVTSFIVPIVDVSDEVEHLTRAEITSQGVLIPHWTGDDVGIDRLYNHTDGELSKELNKNVGFETIESINFFNHNRENTVFETQNDTHKIDYTPFIRGSAFEQNAFFGYIPQAFGILIAKLLDLNVIWMLWLGRICNLMCYAFLISLAIKITPKLKMPLFAISCIPITIYQAASVSIDSMIFGLGILTIAYFIRLYLLKDKSIDIKEMVIFTLLCALLGLCKLPYLAFIFLILFIPKENFKNEKYSLIMKILAILIVSIIGISWSKYSTPTLMHSWRSSYNYVDSAAQLNYLITNPNQILNFLAHIFTIDLGYVVNGVFNFFNGKLGLHYQDHYVFITVVLQFFLMAVLFFYPSDCNFNLKTKLGALFVLLVVYIGTCFIQLLTWSYVGQINLGVSIRYFIPLLALIPIIVPHKNYFSQKEFDNYAMIFIISFMAALILAFATKYY